MKKYFLIVVYLLSASSVSFGQVHMDLGIYIKYLEIDNLNYSFYADFYWWCKLPPTLSDSLIREYSKLEIVNSKSNELTITEIKHLDDFVYISGRCQGDFMFQPDYKNYPFDIQNLSIIFESVNLPIELIMLNPDTSAYSNSKHYELAEDISLPNYKITTSGFDKFSKTYKTNFGDSEFQNNSQFSRLSYGIRIQRISKSYMLKILIPSFLLIIISYLVFFIPANNLDVAVGCTVTSLLACIALQLTTEGDLPNIGYLTVSDKLFYFMYALICAALVQTVITYNLEKVGKIKLSDRLEYAGKIFYPIAFFAGVFMLTLT